MKKINESLNEVLDIQAEVIQEETKDLVPITPTPNLPAIVPPVETIEDERKKDLEKSRKVMSGLMESGQTAIESLAILANESEEPRAYEVLAELIDKIGNIAEKAYKLRKDEAEINRIDSQINDNNPNAKTINNTAIFVGSTNDLVRAIKGKT